jgi:hypothetical protein
VSVESFAAEMKEYIDAKNNRNFRLLFFVDEVSQFIGQHRDLLLQLQSLVKRLDEVCESKVWIACTAQQTLEEVVSNVGGNATNPEDEVGKILVVSRFVLHCRVLLLNISLRSVFSTRKAMLKSCSPICSTKTRLSWMLSLSCQHL